jgi:hypothetical protein
LKYPNGIENRINDRPFFQGALRAGITGAVTGAISFGIGTVANASFTAGSFSKIAFQTVAHGYLGGFSSVANGGDFLSGMASGALGSLAASGTGALLKGASVGWEAAGTIASGGLMGGIGAEISGGNFWDGARNGLISAGLNHAAHMMMDRQQQPSPKDAKKLKMLSKGEIKQLKNRGVWDHHDKDNGGKQDLYKDAKGNIYEVGKGGKGGSRANRYKY